MNLNKSPSIEQLKILFSSCDDDAGHHVLWVARDGTVNLTLIPEELTPVGFEGSTSQMQMRYETYGQGNKYVGESAAKDDEFMNQVFSSLTKEWPNAKDNKEVEYIDFY